MICQLLFTLFCVTLIAVVGGILLADYFHGDL